MKFAAVVLIIVLAAGYFYRDRIIQVAAGFSSNVSGNGAMNAADAQMGSKPKPR